MTALPGPLDRRRLARFVLEAAVMVSPLVVSELLGRFALPSERTAFDHAEQIARLEHTLGVDVEHHVTAVAAAHPTLHTAATGYYATVHFVGTAAAALTLALLRPGRWAGMRTAFLVASGLALVISRLWPLMPPNLAGPGIGSAGAVLPASHPPNAYAAMPSLHTVWALWTAAALVLATRRTRPAVRWPVAVLGGAHVAATVAIVLGLGHHFVADVLAGVAVAAAGAGGAAVVHARTRRGRRARSPRGPATIQALVTA
ncbi:phosphatase PAP2 family protein [Actinomycetospora sp. TBRC 11914]|uniref:phosphatase PAP2 family protein n=1 Tax=Actinomycetospora sp. TBRC 11914 TaxID=2729387 RepID=UPI00145F3F89|nr:phosphatase PAP2 family protein [Actinomycetospora sp. TBRC 11914]NMO88303.1 phosphatase PAP2 family protein [Actinomycetospora sp. TBRC 11914]